LRERLEQAGSLTADVRDALKRADGRGIEAATSRLETLALELKLLHAEYRRLPAEDAGRDEPALTHARAALEAAATRLARSSAAGGGLLERLVTMSRNLIGTVQAARGETYEASGHTRDLPVEGLRLRKQV
jgi:hypothetical protein